MRHVVNGDGKVDLISVNSSDSTLSVLTNSGKGGFVLASSPAVGSNPNSLTTADVNGDGKLDLISANYYGNSLSVLTNALQTNNTYGGFIAAGTYTVGQYPREVAAVDVNGDGKVDLISGNEGSDTVSVLTNDGSGGFVLAQTLAGQRGAGPVTTADVNGDGKVDIICANFVANTLSIFTNNGSGNFVLASTPSIGSGCRSVVAADVNGDGKVDLISANYYDNTLSVLTNNGSGGFVLAATIGVGNAPTAVLATNVSGNGKVDLVCANFNDNTLSVLTNSGGGYFGLATNLSVGSGPWWITAADVNGDGRLDLISANASGNTLSVLINKTPFLPVITVQPANQTVAAGNNATFNVTANGAVPLSYQWRFVTTNIVWATNAILTLTNVQPNQAGNYSVFVTNAYGSVLSSNAALTVTGLPPVITLQPTNQTVSAGGTAHFTVTATGSLPPLSYQWEFDGTNISGATNVMLTLTNVQFDQAGIYTVLVTNYFGSALSSNAVLTVTVDHFTWSAIPSPRYINTPFAVSIQARDQANGLVTNYSGTVLLTSTSGIAVSQPVSGNFVQGAWTGSVAIAQTISNLVLQASDGSGHFGLANPISVIGLPHLGVLYSGNIAMFVWPVQYGGFVLESSGSLVEPTWVPVPYSPLQIGDQYMLPLDMIGSNNFYRLWFLGP